MLELDSTDSDNQVLTVLCSRKETQVTWTYSKKVLDGVNDNTEATEELTKLLTVSMPFAIFKQAIFQHTLPVLNFVKDKFNFHIVISKI